MCVSRESPNVLNLKIQKRFFSKTALQSSDFEKYDGSDILRLKDVFLI